ncbi:MAG: molybdopterin-dependent oxidoreductase [Acidimicrobiia bacterium]|nr:molybdopterin-dependent oxidoreductase [Acidimicrobiia bacterium]
METQAPTTGVRVDDVPDGTYPTATHWGRYLAEVRDGVVVELRAVPDDPLPSPIGFGMPQAQRDEVRITEPHAREGWLRIGPGDTRDGRGRRGGERYVPLGWDEAIERTAVELDRVRTTFGNSSIFGGSYGWGSAGRFHHAQSQVHRFLNVIGGYTRSVNSYSSAALEVILNRVAGGKEAASESTPTWDQIRDHGNLVVAFGGLAPKNAQVSSGGVSRHLAMAAQQECRQAGVRFVSLSPVRDDASDLIEADWLPVRPNTDVAVMLGIAHTLVAEGLHDLDFLTRSCEGWDRFEPYLMGAVDGQPKDAAWASVISEVPAAVIEDLARRIARSRSVITASYSVQRAHHGEQSHWMALTLAAMSGSMGRPGGGYGVGLGAMHRNGLQQSPFSVASFPQGDNPVPDFIPVARITDLLMNAGGHVDYDGRHLTYPDIRLIYWAGGNPFHHHQDLNRLLAAWQRPETVVVHEQWWNPLARHADVVFPVATTLERADIGWGRGDYTVSAMQRAATPPDGVTTDFEIFSALAAALGVEEQFTEGRTADEWVRHLYDRSRTVAAETGFELPPFEEFWEAGQVHFTPEPAPPSAYELLREDPAAHPIRTPSGRLEIYSETIAGFGYDDCPPHPTWMEPAEWLGSPLAERFPLHLCSGQPVTRLHSQYDNGGYSRSRKIRGREPITISLADAETRGISDGDVVRVFNDRGVCLAGAVVTDAISPGVVSLSTGAWYDPLDPATPGSLDVHGNPNVLTLDIGTSKLAQGTSAHTCLVDVERYDGELPPINAFSPPEFAPPFGFHGL